MRNLKWWIILCGIVFCLGLVGTFFVLKKSESTFVEIIQDGVVLYNLDLSEYHEPQTIEITTEKGNNTILIENGRICISHADCPDETCVKSGWLSSSLPIVCLPHHLVIRFSEDNTNQVDETAR